jgi:hypothetical protein
MIELVMSWIMPLFLKEIDFFETQSVNIQTQLQLNLPKGFNVNNNRRTFFMTLAAGTSLLATSAQSQAKADEKDPQSVALGYVADATKTDTKKYPKYAAGQVCTNCALYQGKASDAWGGCPLFAGKQVAGKGWCSAWAKKG